MIKGTYEIFVGNYDWGAAVDKAVLTLEVPVEKIDKKEIAVKERKQVPDMNVITYPLHEKIFDRTVTDAYLCDKTGKRIEGPSQYVAVELYVSPEEGTPFAPTTVTQIFRWTDPYELHFSIPGMEIAPKFTKRTTAADMFAKKTYTTPEGIRYDYAEFIPEMETETLFVWLHGLGEGQLEGSDVYLPLLGRKGTTMAGEKFQKMIGGAVVLVPQCPTYWMDNDGKMTNVLTDDGMKLGADGTSFYTKSLEAFIDKYASEHGCKKIVLAGCSNGGYMTLMLAINAPEKYAGIVPICEAVADSTISEESIQKLLNVPMYFIYSKDDPVVIPEIHEIPTIQRLKAAGCKDLHVCELEHVFDTSGTYKDTNGDPYKYMGHLSWIYYDNNETDDGQGLSAWEWIAGLVK